MRATIYKKMEIFLKKKIPSEVKQKDKNVLVIIFY